MNSSYNMSPRRRFAVFAALIAGSWAMVAVAANTVLHLAQ